MMMMMFNRISCQSLRLALVLERRIVSLQQQQQQQQQLRYLSDVNSIKIDTVQNNTNIRADNSDVDVNNNNNYNNISTSNSNTTNNNEPKSKRRIRHTFRNNSTIDNIPSFKDFQQTKQIRTLYRQYIRLFKTRQSGDDNNTAIIADTPTITNTTTNNVSKELKDQVRREFRQQHTDSWSIKKALSEGTRRYKDLSAMIGMPSSSSSSSSSSSNNTNSDTNTDNKDQSSVISNQKWPWDNNSNNIKRPPPLRFPKRS